MSTRFNKTTLDSLQVPDGKSYLILRDSLVKGLYIKIGRTGRTFFMEKRIAGCKGNAITIKIGGFPLLTIEVARRQARQIAALCERGQDPREAFHKDLPVLSLEQAFHKFLELKKIRPSTRGIYQSLFKNHLARWQHRNMNTLTADDLYVAFLSIESHTMARESMLLFNNIWKTVAPVFRERNRRILQNNPFPQFRELIGTAGWKRQPTREQAIITIDELGKYIAWLEQLSEQETVAIGERRQYRAYLLCLFTGLRYGEAARLEWSHVDFDKSKVTVIREKSKNRHAHEAYMSDYVSAMLGRIHQERETTSPFVFPSVRSIHRPIQKRSALHRKLGTLYGFYFTSHANRRTFASVGQEIGLPYLVIKRCLNHLYRGDTTGLYVNLAFNPASFKKAFQEVSDFLIGKRNEYLAENRHRMHDRRIVAVSPAEIREVVR